MSIQAEMMKIKAEFDKAIEDAVAKYEENLKPQGVWQPKDGDQCVAVRRNGDPINIFYSKSNYKKEFEQGSIFATEKEAELKADKREVTQKLRGVAGGFKPDWENLGQDVEVITYVPSEQRFEVYKFTKGSWHYIGLLDVYFRGGKAQHAIDTLGDELLCLFDVDEKS